MTICNIKAYQVVFDKYKNCCPLIPSLIFYIVFWRQHTRVQQLLRKDTETKIRTQLQKLRKGRPQRSK